MNEVSSRVQDLQRHLGLRPDGLLGPVTLTRLELARLPETPAFEELVALLAPASGLVISRKALDMIVHHEISSEAYYLARLTKPVWPGGGSGVTIGIGYDLGYQTRAQIEIDWGGLLPGGVITRLQTASGVKGSAAQSLAATAPFRSITVPLQAARENFYLATLPRYAAMTRTAYAGVERLPADAQGGMLSLVFNRGAGMAGETRREMRELRPLVQAMDLEGMARKIVAMRRLWVGKGLPGLLKRRDDEARIIQFANRPYVPAELVRV